MSERTPALHTDNVATLDAVDEAHSTITAQLSLMFDTMTQTLTDQQMCLLRAISSRARKALVEKDILDNIAGVYSFQDPVYAYWLKHHYFLL